jgi:hypothetical protein
MVPGPQQLNVGTTLQSASLWQVFIGGSQLVMGGAQKAGTPPSPAPPDPTVAPPLPLLPPEPNAPPQIKQTSNPPVPATPPDEKDPAAPPLALSPAEPPFAAVEPSGRFVEGDTELDEQAITATKSGPMRLHRSAAKVPEAPLMLRHSSNARATSRTRASRAICGADAAQCVPGTGGGAAP